MDKKKLLFIFIVIAIALFFFAKQEIVPLSLYALPVIGLAIYFWPVKMILELVKNRGYKKIIVAIVSNFLYSAVLCISAVWLYYPDGSFFQIAFSIIGLANALTGLVYFLGSIDDEKAILHFMLNLICVALL
jgi:hypothetical protein